MAWLSSGSSAHSYVVSGKGSDLSVPVFLFYKVGIVTALIRLQRSQGARALKQRPACPLNTRHDILR